MTTDTNFNNTLHSTGTFKRKVYLYKNDSLIDTLTFDQIVLANPGFSWNNQNIFSNPYEGSISTMEGFPIQNATIRANKDYEWDLRLNPVLNFNHGITVSIPIPDHFVMDEAITKNINTELINDYHASITQSGITIKVDLPQFTDSEISKLAGQCTPIFKLVGSFKMDEPDSDIQLSNNNHPNLIENTGNVSSQVTINSVYVNIVKKSSSIDDTKGYVIKAGIDPDTIDTYNENVTYIDNTIPHSLNKNIYFQNMTTNDLKNLTATINIADGMDITDLIAPYNTLANLSKCNLTLDDGTIYSPKLNDNISAPSGHTIKKIKLIFDDFLPYEKVDNLELKGVLAKKYSDGRIVKENDGLVTTMTIKADNLIGIATKECGQVIIKKPNFDNLSYNEISATAKQTSKNAGSITLNTIKLINNPTRLIYYIALPDNATVNLSDVITELPNAKVSEFIANKQTVLKIDGYFSALDSINIQLSNQNIIDTEFSDDPYDIYVVLPNDQVLNHNERVQNIFELAYVENSNNAYRLFNGTWEIITSLGSYSTSQAQGNNNAALTTSASSDSNGSKDMAFSTVIVNS